MPSPIKQLKKISATTAPSRQFKRELWVKLDQGFNCVYPTAMVSWRRIIAIPVASFCLVIVMGTGTYAYASPNVSEGDMLFTVKRGLESVEGRFHPSDEAQEKYERRIIRRRIQEGEILRNKLQRVRVRIDESSLPAEEKVELLLKLDLDIERLTDSVNQ